jgi:hypothetical protein
MAGTVRNMAGINKAMSATLPGSSFLMSTPPNFSQPQESDGIRESSVWLLQQGNSPQESAAGRRRILTRRDH